MVNTLLGQQMVSMPEVSFTGTESLIVQMFGTLKAKSSEIDMIFLSYVLPLYTNDHVVKVANPKLMNNVMAEIRIPVPSSQVQKKVVSEIESLQKKNSN